MSEEEAVQSSAALECIYVSCQHQWANAISVELCFAEGAHLSPGALPERLPQMLQTAGSFTVSSILPHYLPYNLWRKYKCGHYKEGWLIRERNAEGQHSLDSASHRISGPGVPQPWECMALCQEPVSWPHPSADVPDDLHPQGAAWCQSLWLIPPSPALPRLRHQALSAGPCWPGSPWNPSPPAQGAAISPASCQIHWKSWLCHWSFKSSDLSTQMELKCTFLFRKVRDNSVKSTNIYFLIISLLQIQWK